MRDEDLYRLGHRRVRDSPRDGAAEHTQVNGCLDIPACRKTVYICRCASPVIGSGYGRSCHWVYSCQHRYCVADRSTSLVRRSLTDHIRVRQQRDSGSVPNGEVHHAQSQNGPQPEDPASANTSQPAPAPAAAQEQARPPEQEERLQQLVTYIRSAVDNFDMVSSAAFSLCPCPGLLLLQQADGCTEGVMSSTWMSLAGVSQPGSCAVNW